MPSLTKNGVLDAAVIGVFEISAYKYADSFSLQNGFKSSAVPVRVCVCVYCARARTHFMR